MNNLPIFMKKNNLLKDSRKTYNKINKIMIKNAIKGKGATLYYYRIVKMRKIILKWYYRNEYSLTMLGLDNFDFAIKYGYTHYVDHINDDNIIHIYKLVKHFYKTLEQIEDYYG